MDRLIQMGKDLGHAGEKLQAFIKQQQDYERGERIAKRELERDRIAAQEKERADKLAERADKFAAQENDREIELAKIAAQEKDREIELARIATEEAKTAADERLEMARIEGIAEQAERDRELKRAELETDRESKLSSEIELEKLKHTVISLSFRTDKSGQIVLTQIRLLLEEQSDQRLHCLPFGLHRLDSLLYGRAT